MRTWSTIAVLALVLLLGGIPAGAQSEPRFHVIVNPASKVTTLDRAFVAGAFLKKTTRWPGGGSVQPCDLKPDNPARRAFSDKVIGRSVSAVKSYWQQIIFSGRGVPPPELADDAAVIRYVRKHPGAIGYVSPEADLSAVKVVSLR